MKKITVLFVIVVMTPVLAFSQYSIEGRVTDQTTGETLSGAHIVVNGTFLTTISDPDGLYKISNLKKGTYDLMVSYIGYKTQHIEVQLDHSLTLNIQMIPSPITEETVIIKATRANEKIPETYTNVTRKEINEVNLGKDMPFILSMTPSLTMTSDAGNDIGYSAIQIRGTDITRINVTINGVPLNDAESQDVYWVDLPDLATSVQDIQIQRGVGTSTNGDAAFGASVNIQTAVLHPEPYANLDNNLGSFHSVRNSLTAGTGLIKDKFAFDTRLSRITSAGYIDRASSDLRSYFLTGGYYGNKTILKINVFSGLEKTYQAWGGVPSNVIDTNRTYNPEGEYINDEGKIDYYDNQTDNYKQDHVQVVLSQEIGHYFIFNLTLHHTHGIGYYESYMTDQKLSSYGPGIFIADSGVARSDLIRQKWLDNLFSGCVFSILYNDHKRTSLTLGGSWNTYDGEHYGHVIWARDAIVRDKEIKYYSDTGDKTDGNIFAKMEYTLATKLNLYGDVQFRNIEYKLKGTDDKLRNVTQSHRYTFFNPKLGLIYTITDKHKAYFSFGIANREPNRRNYLDADSSRQPSPERLNDFELGYQFSLPHFKLGVNLYYMDYNDQLVLTGEINNVGDPIMVNVPKSYRAGIETTAGAYILKNLQWNANASFSRNKILDFTEYIDNWDTGGQDSKFLGTTDLSFSPDLIINNIFNYEPLKNLNFILSSKYVGKQYIDNTSSNHRKLDPYFINNLIIRYDIKTTIIKNIGISFMINNLFSAKYEANAWIYRYIYEGKEQYMDGYFPQAGINFMAGLNLQF